MKKNISFVSLIALILTALFIIPLLCSCSAKGDYTGNSSYPEVESPKDEDYTGGVSYAPDGSLTSDNAANANRKIIRTFTVYGETKAYDTAISEINTSIAAFNGYISESRVTGASYNYSTTRGRSAYLVIKIPAENLDAFISQIGDTLNVTSSASTQQDVSEAYYSIEARMKTLETERESLLQMMASINTANDYDFWYTLQKKISETEQQIAEYQAILKSYDGQVAYSTVNLTIDEVVEYTPTKEEESTFGERIADAFVESWKNFGVGFMDFTVFMVSAIPTLLIFPGIPAVIVVIVIVVNRKNKKKKEENK